MTRDRIATALSGILTGRTGCIYQAAAARRDVDVGGLELAPPGVQGHPPPPGLDLARARGDGAVVDAEGVRAGEPGGHARQLVEALLEGLRLARRQLDGALEPGTRGRVATGDLV